MGSITKFSDHYSDKGTTYANDKPRIDKSKNLKGGISDLKIENVKNQTFNSDVEDSGSIHGLVGSTMVSSNISQM